MAGQANATRPRSSLAWAGSSMCCHAPRGALLSPARTAYQHVGPRSGCRVVYSVRCRVSEQTSVSGSRPPDTDRVRRAGAHPHCRRPKLRRSARACAAATARRTEAAAVVAQAPGTGRLLPARADLVATTIPWITSRYFLARAVAVKHCSKEPCQRPYYQRLEVRGADRRAKRSRSIQSPATETLVTPASQQ